MLRVVEDAVGQVLLEDLAVVDLLLDRSRRDEPVDGNVLRLADAPGSLAGLGVRGRVPVRVVDDDPGGARQVDAEPADARREDEDEHGRVFVELFDERLASRYLRRAVYLEVGVGATLDECFKNGQHLSNKDEQKRTDVKSENSNASGLTGLNFGHHKLAVT